MFWFGTTNSRGKDRGMSDLIERLRHISKWVYDTDIENAVYEATAEIEELRPVQHWNKGKQQEFSDRKTFDVDK
jgi:hypothetical protein